MRNLGWLIDLIDMGKSLVELAVWAMGLVAMTGYAVVAWKIVRML